MSYADDRAEIENLIARYFWAFDTFDADAFEQLFAPEGAVVLTAPGLPPDGLEFAGRAGLADFLETIRVRTGSPPFDPQQLRFSPNVHYLANLVLTVDGDAAYARAYWFTVRRGANHDQVTDPHPNPSFLASAGYYDEQFSRVAGQWRFERVVVREFGPGVAASGTPLI